MERKQVFLSILLVFAIILFPTVSAEILMGDVEGVYNVGDNLNITIGVSSSYEVNDFLIANLVCFDFEDNVVIVNKTIIDNGNESDDNVTEEIETITINQGSAEIYKSSLSISSGEEKEVPISVKLDKSVIGNLTGSCAIRAMYDGQSEESRVFDLTKMLDIELDIRGVIFEPEDKVNILGKAYKKKGGLVNGFAKVYVPKFNVSVVDLTKEGEFNFNFTIPEDAHGGKYELIVDVYERDNNGDLINFGNISGEFKVKQTNDEINIAINSQTIVPGEDFVYTIMLYDRAGDEVMDDASVLLYYPNGEIVEKRLSRTGKSDSLHIGLNDTPGYWRIDTFLGDLKATKTFFVEELQKIEFELVNDTLIINNIGNVEYTKAIAVNIGGTNELIEVEIPINGKKTLKLFAPEGDYEISVKSGEETKSMGTSFLTGNAIAIKDMDNIRFGGIGGIVIWIIVIIILAAIILYLYRKIKKLSLFGKKERYSNIPYSPIDKKAQEQDKSIKKGKTAMLVSSKAKLPSKIESSAEKTNIIDAGEKQKAEVVCLKIKNISEIKNGVAAIDRALLKAKAAKSKIYVDGDYRIIIFSEMTTGQKNNSIRAIKIAREIEEILNAHNKIYSKKIEFGIGINSGEMIVERKNGKFRFTSLGNTIVKAKRISENSNKDVLVSEKMHRDIAGIVKTEKLGDDWKVKRIVDREKYSGFIKRFIAGQKK